MKVKNIFLVGMLISASVMMVSCKKDKEKESENSATTQETSIYGKWEVKTAGSKYASFEFNEDGSYVVVENTKSIKSTTAKDLEEKLDKSISFLLTPERRQTHKANEDGVYYGTYSFQDKNTLILLRFGTVVIISITQNELKFSFIPIDSPEQKVDFVATKAKETVAASSRTNMFCRTWYLVKIAGIDVADLEMEGSTMFISRAGTYLIDYADAEGTKQLSQWKWYDYPGTEKETVFVFSHDNWENMGMGIITLLSNDKLILVDGNGYEYELVIKDN